MTHIIVEGCLGEVYAACVDVCPVECIHPGDYKNEKFMIIDPEVCIDCGVCLPECPIGAIVGSVDESPESSEKRSAARRLSCSASSVARHFAWPDTATSDMAAWTKRR